MDVFPDPSHVSQHLKWSELACHDPEKTAYPRDAWWERAIVLAAEFEWIRANAGGQPISPISAYRTYEWNRIMPGGPGAEESQHLYGRALDLSGVDNAHQKRIKESLEKRVLMPESRIRGIGVYAGGGLHYDCRPEETSYVARWNKFRPSEVLVA